MRLAPILWGVGVLRRKHFLLGWRYTDVSYVRKVIVMSHELHLMVRIFSLHCRHKEVIALRLLMSCFLYRSLHLVDALDFFN